MLIFSCTKTHPRNERGAEAYFDYNPEIQIDKGDKVTIDIKGKVFDENHKPLLAAEVRIGEKTAYTNCYGEFTFYDVEANEKYALVTVEREMYFKGYRNFTPKTNEENELSIMLLKKELVGTFDSERGGRVEVAGDHSVTFVPGFTYALRSQNDPIEVYQGKVSVYATYIDPTSEVIDDMIPGSLVGVNSNNQRVDLISYGMLNVELFGENGEKLQLAPKSEAEIRVKVPESLLEQAPVEVPLWYIDDKKGFWVEYGMSTLKDGYFVGNVSHFTPVNVDEGVF